MNGTIKIERKAGTEVFEFEEFGDLSWTTMQAGTTSVCFEAAANTVIAPLEFTENVCSSPLVEAQAFDSDFDPHTLAGKKYSIPESFDGNVGDHVSLFYYAEHLELDNIEIEILTQIGDECEIRWTGNINDHYADPPAKAQTVIEGKFKITEMTNSD